MIKEPQKDSTPEEKDLLWQQIWQRMPSGYDLVSVLDFSDDRLYPSKKNQKWSLMSPETNPINLTEFLEKFGALLTLANKLDMTMNVSFPQGIRISIHARQPAIDYARQHGIPICGDQMLFPLNRPDDISVAIARLMAVMQDLEMYDKFEESLKPKAKQKS